MEIPSYFYDAFKKGEHDPKLFIETFLSPPGKKISPNGPQLDWLLNSYHDENFWAAGNSTGKSWGLAFKHIWYATYKKKYRTTRDEHDKITGGYWRTFDTQDDFFQEPYHTVCLGPDYKQAMIVWQVIESMLNNSPLFNIRTGGVKNVTTGTRRDPHARIELWNGAVIHAVSTGDRGKHIEGADYDYEGFDEPGDEAHLEQVVERILIPRMFRRGGCLDLAGTPKGVNKFFDYWRTGMPYERDGYYFADRGDPNPFFVPGRYSQQNHSDQNPYADQDKIKAARDGKTEEYIQERLQGMFVDSGTHVFKSADIEQCINTELENPTEPKAGHRYVGGADFGQVDSTVFTLLDVTEWPKKPAQLVLQKSFNQVSWEQIFYEFEQIHRKYSVSGNSVYWYIDATGQAGNMQSEWTTQLGIPHFRFVYTPIQKVKIINNLQDLLHKQEITMPYISELKEDLRFFSLDAKEDSRGGHFDRVQSLALACRAMPVGSAIPEPYTY